MAEHELKTWPDQFRAILERRKTFEVRRHDRPFDVGDTLLLKEWDPSPWNPERMYGEVGYTKREARVHVTHILTGGQFGIEPGYCVMAIRLAAEQPEKP